MKISELPSRPMAPELVSSEARNIRGLDLLGLRAPAESVSNHLLDGVTTVTPSVRYLALRSWIILRYLKLGGLNDWKHFYRFAGRVEAAVAFAGVVAGTDSTGVVGRDLANTIVRTMDSPLTLRNLTKILAMSTYAGPSEALGLGSNEGEVPGLTRERGVPLAEAFDRAVSEDKILEAIAVDGEDPTFPRDQLKVLGDRLNMVQPSPDERELLLRSIMPPSPRKKELRRIASYCLLLHLCRQLGREVIESDVFDTACGATLDSVPPELHAACDGWARFVVRDLLVLTHEAAVAMVLKELALAATPEKRRPWREVIAALVADRLDEVLSGAGFDGLTADQPVKDLYTAVLLRLGTVSELRGLRRWDGTLRETSLLGRANWLRSPGGMALLPVAWIVGSQRLEPGLVAGASGADFDAAAGISRMGINAVVLPQVRRWRTSRDTIRETTAWLIQRSVEQHLRIAWSRMAREPHKDVSLLLSDGDEWIYFNDFRAGRATSRLYQAINWLRQLGLIRDGALTSEGKGALEQGLANLRKSEGEA